MASGNHDSPLAVPVRLTLEDRSLQAIVSYHGGPDPSFSEATILQLLSDRAVKYGLDNAAIDRMTVEIRTMKDRRKVEAVVAKGMYPTESTDGRVEFFIADEPEIRVGEDGRTDFRNIRRYKTVEKGQLLARIYPPIRGKDGINVLGDVVDAREPAPAPAKAGENLKTQQGEAGSTEYLAAIEGIFKRIGEKFFVSPELIIEGSAGLETGNLSYNLTIIVKGNVERGTEILAGKDLRVEGLVETGFLRAAGAITVTGGINSGGKGHILCGADLTADFIENSHVICDGSIHLRRSILTSTVISHGSIEFGDRDASVIAGGEILHFADLKVGRIGNQNEVRTIFYPGIHYHNQQIYHTLREEIQEMDKQVQTLAEYLRTVKERLSRMPGSKITEDAKREAREKVQQYHKVREAIDKKKALFSTVQHARRNTLPVKVHVRDVILPGTEFHFKGGIEKIQAPVHHVALTFFPDRSAPKYDPYKD